MCRGVLQGSELTLSKTLPVKLDTCLTLPVKLDTRLCVVEDERVNYARAAGHVTYVQMQCPRSGTCGTRLKTDDLCSRGETRVWERATVRKRELMARAGGMWIATLAPCTSMNIAQ